MLKLSTSFTIQFLKKINNSFFAVFLFFTLFIYNACDDSSYLNQADLLPDSDSISIYKDSVLAQCFTDTTYHAYTSFLYSGMIGYFEDPFFGKVQTGAVFEYYPLYPTFVVADSIVGIDSAFLYLVIDSTLYGDINSTFSLTLDSLTSPLDSAGSYLANFDADSRAAGANLVEESTFTFVKGNNIKLRLKNEFAGSLVKDVSLIPDSFNNERNVLYPEFISAFKKIVSQYTRLRHPLYLKLKPSPESNLDGALAYYNLNTSNSFIKVYYRAKVGKNSDSTLNTSFYFNLSSYNSNFSGLLNNINVLNHDLQEATIKDRLYPNEDSLVFAQSLSGVSILINLDSFARFESKPRRSVHKIIIDMVPDTSFYKITQYDLAQNLTLYYKASTNNVEDNIYTSVKYSTYYNKYVFDITGYYQKLVNDGFKGQLRIIPYNSISGLYSVAIKGSSVKMKVKYNDY